MLTTLKNNFGFDSLRPIQEKVVNEAIKNTDILVVSPTSSGKSLCFQLPALYQGGLTIVISPLKSLIYDQYLGLKKKNIKATLLMSDIGVKERNIILDNLKPNNLKFNLLYTTPETLYTNFELTEILSDLYDNNLLTRFAIDEAHCVSTWGHDFRPHYLKMNTLKKNYPNVPIMALTASATNKVEADIKHLLGINNCKLFTQSFFRNNLNISIVKKQPKKSTQIIDIINKYQNQSGIIYCHSRQQCEELSCFLKENDILSEYYHAGMTKKSREKLQQDWLDNKLYIIVATIAFGMGIDKPDVRFVIHYNLPLSLEGYYQEIGRAGRDGKKSDCILLYNLQDKIVYQKMILSENNKNNIKKIQFNKERLNKLLDIISYLENLIDCKHYLLSTYFGEKIDNKVNFCKNKCDTCNKNIKYKDKDYTEISKNILEAIITLDNVGASRTKVKNLIKGSKIMKKFVNNKVYGIQKQESNQLIDRLITYLIINKYIKETLFKNKSGFWNERLKLYQKSNDILNDSDKILLPIEDKKRIIIIKRKKVSNTSNDLNTEDLETKLKEYRINKARLKDVPLYCIFNNKTMAQIIDKQPKTISDLEKINGIGPKKLEEYGWDIINLLK